jgi:hypothetical protein
MDEVAAIQNRNEGKDKKGRYELDRNEKRLMSNTF